MTEVTIPKHVVSYKHRNTLNAGEALNSWMVGSFSDNHGRQLTFEKQLHMRRELIYFKPGNSSKLLQRKAFAREREQRKEPPFQQKKIVKSIVGLPLNLRVKGKRGERRGETSPM